MNNELVKQLKKAGFPRSDEWSRIEFGDTKEVVMGYDTGDEVFLKPTLLELIEECGDDLLEFYKTPNKTWRSDIKGQRDDVDYIIVNYKDNEACPPEIVKSIEQRKNRTGWYNVYGL